MATLLPSSAALTRFSARSPARPQVTLKGHLYNSRRGGNRTLNPVPGYQPGVGSHVPLFRTFAGTSDVTRRDLVI